MVHTFRIPKSQFLVIVGMECSFAAIVGIIQSEKWDPHILSSASVVITLIHRDCIVVLSILSSLRSVVVPFSVLMFLISPFVLPKELTDRSLTWKTRSSRTVRILLRQVNYQRGLCRSANALQRIILCIVIGVYLLSHSCINRLCYVCDICTLL